VDNEIEVSVEGPVEVTDEGQIIVIMRVMKGDLRPGSRLDAVREVSGEERSVALTVQRMWLFTREVDLIGPSYSGKLELTGDANGEILPGSLLLSKE
jgi:hypothetical protein